MRRFNFLPGTLLTLSSVLLTLSVSGQSLALEVGSLSEIEGDASCGLRKAGGTLVYAETASNRIYVCSDATNVTEPRHLLVFNRFTDKGTFVTTDSPRQLRYFEFTDADTGNTYVLQMPLSQVPNPVFAVELANGLRFEESVSKYLAKSATEDSSALPLQRGDRSQAVANLQRDLQKLGFNPGPIDGIFGSRTEAALRAFQRQAGIATSGIYDRATSQALFDRVD